MLHNQVDIIKHKWYGEITYELLEQFKLVRLCPYTIPLGGLLRLAVAGAIWRLASTPASGSNASSFLRWWRRQ